MSVETSESQQQQNAAALGSSSPRATPSSSSPSAPETQSKSTSVIRRPIRSLGILAAKMPNSTVNSFCGAMAGMASGIVTCPLDVIKTRLQSQGSFRRGTYIRQPTSKALYSGLVGTARVIWREDGLRGMYRGLGPMLLGYLPTWAVYMSVYDSSKDFYYSNIGQWLALGWRFFIREMGQANCE